MFVKLILYFCYWRASVFFFLLTRLIMPPSMQDSSFVLTDSKWKRSWKVLELKAVRTLSSRIDSIIREALSCCRPRWSVLPLSSSFQPNGNGQLLAPSKPKVNETFYFRRSHCNVSISTWVVSAPPWRISVIAWVQENCVRQGAIKHRRCKYADTPTKDWITFHNRESCFK